MRNPGCSRTPGTGHAAGVSFLCWCGPNIKRPKERALAVALAHRRRYTLFRIGDSGVDLILPIGSVGGLGIPHKQPIRVAALRIRRSANHSSYLVVSDGEDVIDLFAPWRFSTTVQLERFQKFCDWDETEGRDLAPDSGRGFE